MHKAHALGGALIVAGTLGGWHTRSFKLFAWLAGLGFAVLSTAA